MWTYEYLVNDITVKEDTSLFDTSKEWVTPYKSGVHFKSDVLLYRNDMIYQFSKADETLLLDEASKHPTASKYEQGRLVISL